MKFKQNKFTTYSIILLRIALGILMFYSGITKIFASEKWSATYFLENVAYGPFKDFFLNFANSATTDFLVMWGLTLIGLALIFGLLTRLASFFGIVIMLLFYFSTFPPEHGLVDEHIIYALVFLFLIAVRVGNIFGLDKYATDFIKKYK